MSKYVLKLLESYNERERKIAVLRYNLEHPTTVSRAEQIEAMNFRHDDSLGHSAGHISNKTLYIALNYEEQAERMNAESAHEIAKELFALECEQRRLTYFIGLLDKRQAEVDSSGVCGRNSHEGSGCQLWLDLPHHRPDQAYCHRKSCGDVCLFRSVSRLIFENVLKMSKPMYLKCHMALWYD